MSRVSHPGSEAVFGYELKKGDRVHCVAMPEQCPHPHMDGEGDLWRCQSCNALLRELTCYEVVKEKPMQCAAEFKDFGTVYRCERDAGHEGLHHRFKLRDGRLVVDTPVWAAKEVPGER